MRITVALALAASMYGVCSIADAADLRGYKGVSWGATPQQVARAVPDVSCSPIPIKKAPSEENYICSRMTYIRDVRAHQYFWFRDDRLVWMDVIFPKTQFTHVLATYKAQFGPPQDTDKASATWEWEEDELALFIGAISDDGEAKFMPYEQMVRNLRRSDRDWIKSQSRQTPRTPPGTSMSGWVLVSPPFGDLLWGFVHNALEKQQKGLPLGGFDTFLVKHYAPAGKEIGSLLLRNDLPLAYWTKRQVFDSAEACTAEEQKIGWAKLEAEREYAPLGAFALSRFSAQCVPAAAYFSMPDE